MKQKFNSFFELVKSTNIECPKAIGFFINYAA